MKLGSSWVPPAPSGAVRQHEPVLLGQRRESNRGCVCGLLVPYVSVVSCVDFAESPIYVLSDAA